MCEEMKRAKLEDGILFWGGMWRYCRGWVGIGNIEIETWIKQAISDLYD